MARRGTSATGVPRQVDRRAEERLTVTATGRDRAPGPAGEGPECYARRPWVSCSG
jgi:hypothetical protein